VSACDRAVLEPGGDTPAPVTRDSAALFQTDSLAYVLRADATTFDGAVGVTLTNRTGATLYIMNCGGSTGVTLEKRVSGQWQGVWSPGVLACLSPPITVSSGGTYRTNIRVSGGFPQSNLYPQLATADVAGEYRLVWRSVLSSYQDPLPFGEPLPLEWRVSNRFTLTVAPY
jgi:hypothetical protein